MKPMVMNMTEKKLTMSYKTSDSASSRLYGFLYYFKQFNCLFELASMAYLNLYLAMQVLWKALSWIYQ